MTYNKEHHSNYIIATLAHYIDEVSRSTCERLKKNKRGLTCFSKFKITHTQFMDRDTVLPSEICAGCVKHGTGLMHYMASKMQYYDEHECRNMVVIRGSTEYRTLPYKLRNQISNLAMGYYGIPIDGGWTCNNQFTFGELLFNDQKDDKVTEAADEDAVHVINESKHHIPDSNQGAWDLTMLKVSKAISEWNMQAMLNRLNNLTEKVESLEARIHDDI